MPNVLEGDGPVADCRFAIVVSRYNESITSNLLSGALDTLAAAGLADEALDVAWGPGARRIPLVAGRLAAAAI